MTRADEQDVAGPHRHAVVALRRLEILAEHVVAGLEPGDAAHSRHVEQNAAADQPVLEDVDRARLSRAGGERPTGLPPKNEPSKATWQKASMCVCPSLW